MDCGWILDGTKCFLGCLYLPLSACCIDYLEIFGPKTSSLMSSLGSFLEDLYPKITPSQSSKLS